MIWLLCLWLAPGFALCAFLACAYYAKKLAKIRERVEARRMHEELDRLEMHDVMQRGDWR